jgi:hypothetical protein
MKTRLCVFFISTLLSLNLHAGFKTGNDIKSGLLKSDAGSTDYDAAWAFGYVIGASDTLQSASYVCLPKVTAGQILSVVSKYFRDNPEDLHRSAELMIYRALVRQWPCKKSSNNNEGDPTPPAVPKPKPKPKPQDTSPF